MIFACDAAAVRLCDVAIYPQIAAFVGLRTKPATDLKVRSPSVRRGYLPA